MTTVLPDGSAFFVAEIDINAPIGDPIKWNPWNRSYRIIATAQSITI